MRTLSKLHVCIYVCVYTYIYTHIHTRTHTKTNLNTSILDLELIKIQKSKYLIWFQYNFQIKSNLQMPPIPNNNVSLFEGQLSTNSMKYGVFGSQFLREIGVKSHQNICLFIFNTFGNKISTNFYFTFQFFNQLTFLWINKLLSLKFIMIIIHMLEQNAP